jgi:hypothetical protein
MNEFKKIVENASKLLNRYDTVIDEETLDEYDHLQGIDDLILNADIETEDVEDDGELIDIKTDLSTDEKEKIRWIVDNVDALEMEPTLNAIDKIFNSNSFVTLNTNEADSIAVLMKLLIELPEFRLRQII